jgi:PhoD-like phosphatase
LARCSGMWAAAMRPSGSRRIARASSRCAATGSAATFLVSGHSYALVTVGDLEPAASCPYVVRLGGQQVWPLPHSSYPASLIRTTEAGRPFKLLFGSCRSRASVKVKDPTGSGHDVLAAYARRMAGIPPEDWPQALLMLGDQVYADDTSPATREFIAGRRDPKVAPHMEVADFEEYTRLYAEAWGDPDGRWLLSTMPSSMIFDDHDVLDDWNTSAAWRAEIRGTSWWNERITGAFMSYWIYQYLGNLSPADLDKDAFAPARTAAAAPPIVGTDTMSRCRWVACR